MPRTKRPVKRQEKSDKEDDALKKLNKMVMEQKKKIDNRTHLELMSLELSFKILLGSIKAQYLDMTIGQLKSELHLPEVAKTRRARNLTRSGSHDDGYLTENSSQGSNERVSKKIAASYMSTTTTSSTGRRSRSADTSSRKPLLTASKTIQRRRSKSVYRTPAYNKSGAVTYPAITPKVTPQTPLTILRQPRQGEMVVSMSGSPVMVPSLFTMQPQEKANCNILLQDGTMLSIQPKHLRQSQAYIPYSLMDANTLDQLRTLKETLNKVVKLGEKNIS